MKKVFIMHPSFESFGGAERALMNLLDMVLTPEEYTVDVLLNTHEGLDALTFPTNVHFLPPLPKLCLPGIKEAKEKVVLLNSRQGVDNVRNWEILKPAMPSFEGYDLAVGYLGIETVRFVADKVEAIKKIAWVHGMYRYHIMRACSDYTPSRAAPFYEKMDAIVNVSKTGAQQFKELFPQLAGRTFAIRNLNDLERIHRLSKAFYPPEYEKLKNRKIVFCAARVDPYKGIDILVEAANLVQQKGMDVAWVVAGYKHSGWEKLQSQIDKYKLNLNVFLLGHVANPYPYFLHSDIVVLPSRSEGEGISIIEAKVLEKAVVATNFEAVTDTLQHRVSGHICSMDAEGFAQGVMEVLEDDALRTAYETYCRENPVQNELGKYAELFTIKKQTEELGMSVVIACSAQNAFPEELMAALYGQTAKGVEVILAAAQWGDAQQKRLDAWREKWQSRGPAPTLQTGGHLATAVGTALKSATGGCICLARPEDRLEATFCEELVGFLNEHLYTDVAVCSSQKDGSALPFFSSQFIENYFLNHISPCTGQYVARKEYLMQSNLLNTLFLCKEEGDWAPAYLIGLGLGNGKLGYVNKPLYHCAAAETSPQDATVKKQIVKMLDVDEERKSEWTSMITLGEIREEMDQQLHAAMRKTSTKDVGFWDIFFKNLSGCWEMAEKFLKARPDESLAINNEVKDCHRIVGYGALGRVAKRVLPLLQNTPLCPTELWDKMGKEGSDVLPPAFNTLQKGDAAVIFVKDIFLSNTIVDAFKKAGVTKIYTYDDIQTYILAYQEYNMWTRSP